MKQQNRNRKISPFSKWIGMGVGLQLAVQLSGASSLLAQDTRDQSKRLVTLTGTLKPEFTVPVDANEMKAIVEGLKSVESLDPITMDINDLMKPEDEAALKAVAQTISGSLLNAAKNIVNMKMLAYKLSAISQANPSAMMKDELFDVYQKQFATGYNALIGSFAPDRGLLLKHLSQCYSELCVLQIVKAEEELVEFGAELDRGIKVKDLGSFEFKFEFRNSLIKASFEATFESLHAPNQEHSAYRTLIMGALTPFVAAARGVAKIAANTAYLLASPRVTETKLYAKKIGIKVSDRKEAIQFTGKSHLTDIVAGKRESTKPSPVPVLHGKPKFGSMHKVPHYNELYAYESPYFEIDGKAVPLNWGSSDAKLFCQGLGLMSFADFAEVQMDHDSAGESAFNELVARRDTGGILVATVYCSHSKQLQQELVAQRSEVATQVTLTQVQIKVLGEFFAVDVRVFNRGNSSVPYENQYSANTFGWNYCQKLLGSTTRYISDEKSAIKRMPLRDPIQHRILLALISDVKTASFSFTRNTGRVSTDPTIVNFGLESITCNY